MTTTPHTTHFVTPTHTFGLLNPNLEGKILSIAGFVHTLRDHGELIFADIWDGQGLFQVVASADIHLPSFEQFKNIRPESTVFVEGLFRRRPQDNINTAVVLGEWELTANRVDVISVAQPLPFPIQDCQTVTEPVLLKYRYLHLRSQKLQENLRIRSEFLHILRGHFHNEEFVEVETPLLFKSTPEGARDFLVPSRLQRGHFYALTQSPQLMKQLLMIGGFRRYLQITRCFRDEDQRSDRQPEFSQVDVEMSFLDMPSVMGLVENIFLKTLRDIQAWQVKREKICRPLQVPIPQKIPKISFDHSMLHYGNDRPDFRFALPIFSSTEVLAQTSFQAFASVLSRGGWVHHLVLPRSLQPHGNQQELPRSFLDGLPAFAQRHGAKGLAWVRIQEGGQWQGPLGKYLMEDEKTALLNSCVGDVPLFDKPVYTQRDFEPGTLIFFCADGRYDIVCKTLGALRVHLAQVLQIPTAPSALCWVVDWPLFEWDGERVAPAHHPFTAPENPGKLMGVSPQGLRELVKNPKTAPRAMAYDLVWNGWEIAGGSMRTHNADVLRHVFQLAGMDAEPFEFFLQAFQYGVPPHGGIAMGVERVCSLLCDETAIRDVMAFPKTGNGACLLSQSPAPVTPAQLRTLGLNTVSLP